MNQIWSDKRIAAAADEAEGSSACAVKLALTEMRDEYESHRKAGMEILEEWERITRLAIIRYEKANTRIAELEAELSKHKKLVDTLYGKNYMVHSWHLNGEPELFDTLADDIVFSE